MSNLPAVRIVGGSWWARVVAALRYRVTDHSGCYTSADVDELIREARNEEILAAYDVVSDREREIRLLRGQLREHGIEPIVISVIRKPLSMLIPGPGVRQSA